jgi:hypothetical protein
MDRLGAKFLNTDNLNHEARILSLEHNFQRMYNTEALVKAVK